MKGFIPLLRILALVACLLGTFPCIFLFFVTAQYCCQNKRGEGRGNILVTAASASFGDKSRFCLPAVLKRKRIQTSRYSCLTLHPSESVFCCVWRLFFSWSWRRPLLWRDEDSFPRWRGPSWLRLARAGFRVPDSQVAGRDLQSFILLLPQSHCSLEGWAFQQCFFFFMF